MRLIPVEPENETHCRVLFDLLKERPADAAISHKAMPTWEDHCAFVKSMTPNTRDPEGCYRFSDYNRLGEPRYQGWFLIRVDAIADGVGFYRGAVYLTSRNEVGVSIFRNYHGSGYGPEAVKMLMDEFGERRYIANCNPRNEASIKMFARLGFLHIQNTYALEKE